MRKQLKKTQTNSHHQVSTASSTVVGFGLHTSLENNLQAAHLAVVI